MWEKEVIHMDGKAVEADSPREAFNTYIEQHDRSEKITGLRVKDSHTFDEGELFETTIYFVEQISIKD